MTSTPHTPPSTPGALIPPQRTLAAAPAPSAAGSATIDPVRLLNKYKFILIGAAVIGAVIGTAAHYVLRKVHPQWTPYALFECVPPYDSVADRTSMISQDEMSRFMQTQVRVLTSDSVLQSVVEDPELQREAPNWCKQFMVADDNGIEKLDEAEAFKELKKEVHARVLPGTNLLELSMSGTNKVDTRVIVGLARQKYLAQLAEQGRVEFDEKIKALRDIVTQNDKESAALALSKETLIDKFGVDSIDNRIEASRAELTTTTETIIDVQRDLASGHTMMTQMDAEWNNPGGIVYGDDLRQSVDRDPQVLNAQQEILALDNFLQSLLEQGVKREHREFHRMQARLDAAHQNLETKRQELLKKEFAGRLDATRKTVAQLEAQEKGLLDRQTNARSKLKELTKIQTQIVDLESKIKGYMDGRSTSNQELNNLSALAQTAGVNRVVLRQRERTPNEMSFPQLKLLLPAGVAFFLGATAGIVLLREIVDQRVKSPSDITLIPRTRLVGWVPDSAEDPAGQGAVETSFRDRGRGMIAESFRQVRGVIAKRITQADHRTILVVGGMPTSGATSVASNLALAFAAADKRVLLVDANFRRPALHRVFALQESPGLADVLAKQRELAEAVQATSTPNLDLLTSGSKEQRVFERLATEGMGEVLAKVRAMYDVVLIDVAPAVVGGDAHALAQRCDATLLVVRAMADKRGMVARIKNELSETKGEFLGVVVNGVKSAAGGYMKRNIQTAHEYANS